MSRFLTGCSALAAAATLSLLSAAPALADGCLVPPAALTPAAVQQFLQNPHQISLDFPAGGQGMSDSARKLAGTDIATVAALVQEAKLGTTLQKQAIGRGLQAASRACVTTRPDLANQIASLVGNGDPALTLAFLTPSLETASIGPGSTAGAGPTGGPLGNTVNSNSGREGGNVSTLNPTEDTSRSYSVSGLGFDGVDGTNGNNGTTVVQVFEQ